jgi:hypothetical protein
MAQPRKAAFQSIGIGVSIGSRCNVASTFVAEADTTGVHGLPMTKPKYLEHPFRSSQFGSPSKRSRMHCPAYRPPHSKREMTLGWSCAPLATQQQSNCALTPLGKSHCRASGEGKNPCANLTCVNSAGPTFHYGAEVWDFGIGGSKWESV